MSGGTGRAGLTIVGQVVGSYFGPIGSMVGGMIGSAIGSALWPEQIEGPKLPEFQAMTSTYGASIPLIWGGWRVGGNVFWCSPIREIEVVEEQGKGGGAELRYKKRLADIAIGLCLGEIVGIRKIWINQKLEYDLGDAADIGTILASFSQGGENMRFYPGSATQLPDPTIEAVKGVGQTPAYRGLAYIVMTDVELGSSFPNITAEVIRGGNVLGTRRLFGRSWDLEMTGLRPRILTVGAEILVHGETSANPAVITAAAHSEPDGDNPQVAAISLVPPFPPNEPANPPGPPVFIGHESLLLAPSGGAAVYVLEMPPSNTSGGRAQTSISQGVDTDSPVDLSGAFMDGGNYIYGLLPCADGEHILALMTEADAGPDPTYWILWRFAEGGITEVRRGTTSGPNNAYRAAGAMSSRNGGAQIHYAGMLESDLFHAWTCHSNAVTLLSIDPSTMVMTAQQFTPMVPEAGSFLSVNIYADKACCWMTTGGYLYGFTRAPALTIDMTLAELQRQLCVMGDLEESQIDVTDLEDIDVKGYAFAQVGGTVRAATEPLMTFYGYDAVESDGKVKFVRRHAVPALTIDQDDLGAGERSASESLVQTTRTSEPELPMLVEGSYTAPHADYQIGTQRVTRGTTESRVKVRLNFPIAASDQEAIEALYRIMYEGWTARYQREFATTVKFAKYEPTDVVDLEVA